MQKKGNESEVISMRTKLIVHICFEVVLTVIIMYMLFYVKSKMDEQAKEYLYEGRVSVVEEMIVENLHNTGELSDKEYMDYKNALYNYTDEPTNERFKEAYKKESEKIKKIAPNVESTEEGKPI